MRSVLKHLLPVLAFVAVGYAQVFGLQKGFLCECGSSPKVILQDHCDSEHHGDDCHENESALPHSKDDHTGGSNPVEHASYKEDVTAGRTLGGKVAVPQPQLHAISFEWLPPAMFNQPVPLVEQNKAFTCDDVRKGWHHMLTHAIVLRV